MSSAHPFDSRLQDYQLRVNRALNHYLPVEDPPEHNLATAMRYAVTGGGKRIRPAMVYAAGEATGAALDVLDIPAAAVEIIHAYSLIHDDLPAMDNDDLRRGRPTCHKAFDEATAMLAGDALQALAYEILARTKQPTLLADNRLIMLKILTEASGAHGMAGGQAIDLASVGKTLSLEQLESMHRLKTGALIHASILLGAMCSGHTSETELNILSNYAHCIGLSFQIQDDILDVVSDTETLGKPQGSDEQQLKPTYPAILGLEIAKQRALEQHQMALTHLRPLGRKADTLRELSSYIVERHY